LKSKIKCVKLFEYWQRIRIAERFRTVSVYRVTECLRWINHFPALSFRLGRMRKPHNIHFTEHKCVEVIRTRNLQGIFYFVNIFFYYYHSSSKFMQHWKAHPMENGDIDWRYSASWMNVEVLHEQILFLKDSRNLRMSCG